MSNVLGIVRQPDYFTITITPPNGTCTVFEVNAHNGNIYSGGGLAGALPAFPAGTSISVVAGWIMCDRNPYATQAVLTDNFLNGVSQNVSGGMIVLGVPINIGGTSVWAVDEARWFNSVEVGLGTPGVSANVAYSSKLGNVENLVQNLVGVVKDMYPNSSDPFRSSWYMVRGGGLSIGTVPEEKGNAGTVLLFPKPLLQY